MAVAVATAREAAATAAAVVPAVQVVAADNPLPHSITIDYGRIKSVISLL